jgi:hypothetical protein
MRELHGEGVAMSQIRILVVGGLTRLDPHYRDAPQGVAVDVAGHDSASLEARARAADAIVLVVGYVSHSAAAKVREIARRRGTPLTSADSASVSRVRGSIAAAFFAAQRAVS